jgi:hypothetical protein
MYDIMWQVEEIHMLDPCILGPMHAIIVLLIIMWNDVCIFFLLFIIYILPRMFVAYILHKCLDFHFNFNKGSGQSYN